MYQHFKGEGRGQQTDSWRKGRAIELDVHKDAIACDLFRACAERKLPNLKPLSQGKEREELWDTVNTKSDHAELLKRCMMGREALLEEANTILKM